VRPFTVVDPAEAVEARLLLAKLAAGGLAVSCLSVRCMPLTPAVLLRLGRLDPLRPDSKLDPPQRQCDSPPPPVEAKGGPLSERIAHAGRTSQNASSKTGPHAHNLHGPPPGSTEDSGSSHRSNVSGSQRAPSPVRNQPLEVHRPHALAVGRRKRLAVGRTAWPPTPLDRQVAPGQPVADRARRRQLDIRTQLTDACGAASWHPSRSDRAAPHIVHQPASRERP